MNLSGRTEYHSEIAATVIKADGTRVELGVVTSPYNDRFRNWAWKKVKEREIRRKLGR